MPQSPQTRAMIERQSKLLEMANDSILILDVDDRITYWNKGCERLYGWTSDEAVGRIAYDLLKTRFPVSFDEIKAHLTGHNTWEGELTQTTRSGSRVRVASRWTLDRDSAGNPQNYLEINRDITEQRRVEQALRDAEGRLRIMLESIVDYAIFTVDREGCISTWNTGAQKQFLYQDREIIGRPVSLLFTPEDRSIGVPDREMAVAAEQGMSHDDRWHLRKDGSRFLATGTLRPMHEDGGHIAGFIKICRDITDRWQAQDAFRRKSEELARTNADLEQFASIASHDLQAPLRTIAGYLQLLERTHGNRLDPEGREFLRIAIDSARKMHTLTQDLLTFARAGAAPRAFAPVNATEVLAQALENLKTAVAETGAQLTSDPLPVVRGEKSQLVQLFQNLIGNALKYRSAEPPRVQVTAKLLDGSYLFSVKDNGIGMDPAHRERIFAPFQRLHTEEEYSGTGIGLAICKRIVENHGGRIWAESEPGRGSTFSFTLPATDPSPSPPR